MAILIAVIMIVPLLLLVVCWPSETPCNRQPAAQFVDAVQPQQVVPLPVLDAMLERASARADALGLSIEFARADLFDSENIVLRGAAKVLLDPPRAGAKALCEALATSKELQSLVYVSCDPASLARDLSILSEGGFHIREAVVVDMFPHTHHLESMVWLSRPSAG